MAEWKPTACMLCTCNCGLEIQLGGEDGRVFTRIRGDKRHPVSRGYICEKPQRLNYYQRNNDRLHAPLRRASNGEFETVDWETAIREVAARLAQIRDRYGGDKILYFGGGGQGNHFPAVYSTATRNVLGMKYSSNALAQEKTGEFWVAGKMFGAWPHPDFENCEVAVFLGKNPWHSHGIARARVTLREMVRDPRRSVIVIDPRRTETAELADIHLAVRPGRDAWLLSAILGVLVQEELIDERWLVGHATDYADVCEILRTISVDGYAKTAGVDAADVRAAAHRIAGAASVAVVEDLGVQQNRHSTLVSYLSRLLWVLTGNFAKKGGMGLPPYAFGMSFGTDEQPVNGEGGRPRSPVTQSRIISGLIPCNVVPDEILTDHPERIRGMIVESSNPAHSVADSQRMRAALKALDFLVVTDVAMTETARLADYVLPTPTQFEKPEATFFNFEYPRNFFHVRHPLLDAPAGLLAEPEIHARLVEALGAMPHDEIGVLREALSAGRPQFGASFMSAMQRNPQLGAVMPVVLYRTLGTTLPEGMAPAAVFWGMAVMGFMRSPDAIRRAGFESADQLFDAIVSGSSGLITAAEDYEECWKRVTTPNGKINVAIPELYDELEGLVGEAPPGGTEEFPFLLSAGERRSFTANTIFRNPEWRKKDRTEALRINPDDARDLGLGDGDLARLTTKRASVKVPVEVTDTMQAGHVSLPNGLGLTYSGVDLESTPIGVAPNDLTASEDRDWIAGTPWHKSVPARVEGPSDPKNARHTSPIDCTLMRF